jgi:predicted dehydrogenase
MVKAADVSGLVAACGFSYRRSLAVGAISEQIKTGALGEIVHFNGRYWCDYSADPDAPTSWRYEGPLGLGALADLGSHLLDLSEQLCGPIVKIAGGTTMDLSCYVLNAARQIGRWLGVTPSVVSAAATLKSPTSTLPCESSWPIQAVSEAGCIGT